MLLSLPVIPKSNDKGEFIMTGKMLCWPLFGTGFDNLGVDHTPCEWDIPVPQSDELLVRIDAIGLCFSDVKLIRAGEDHPRVYSKNLREDPVIPGHEAVMTIVEVGSELTTQFAAGERYIIQADIYVKGKNYAYGYAINGGMAEYSIIDQRVLNGDEGCYLLPIRDTTPAGIAALVEPWTCVIASYMINHRTGPEPDGRMLVAMEPGHESPFLWSSPPASPATIDCLNVNESTRGALKFAFPGAVVNTIHEIPCGNRYDDIILCGIQTPALGEALSKLAKVDALISLVGKPPASDWSFDVGSIHYKGWFFQGTDRHDISEAYGHNVRTKLRKGGTCWLSGGAGAMGQMHTQLAVEDENGPDRILVSDLDPVRIESMVELLRPRIEAKGIEFKTLNPRDFNTQEEFNGAVREFAPAGFDDIVMLVPVPEVVTAASRFLARDGLMNIFAGIPAGKEARLSARDIAVNGCRYIGSSGSRTHHLRHTLQLAESGRLNPATALAAVGGMKALWEGINGVAEARFPGKTVIFPHCPDMPLVPLDKIGAMGEEIAGTLSPEGYYTLETERAIMHEFGTEE